MGIAVDIFGDGAPVQMIHGSGGKSNVWYAQREVLAGSFRVICPDLKGSRDSPPKGELSIDGFVAHIAALLDTRTFPRHMLWVVRAGPWFASIWQSITPSELTALCCWGRLRRRRK